MNNPIAEKLSQASLLMEDTPHPELAEALRIGANEIERLDQQLHRGTSIARGYEINRLVNRFLGWRLPDNFLPDAGISFNPEHNVEYNAARGLPPERHRPTGTNLLDYQQAKAMLEYVLELPPTASEKP